jgi:hypothetical protein
MTATDLLARANTPATPPVAAVHNGRHGLKHSPPAARGRVWARRFTTTLLRY